MTFDAALLMTLDKISSIRRFGLNRHVKQRGWISATNIEQRQQTCRLYGVWTNMRRRCRVKSGHNFYCYGNRGIIVCPQWEKHYGIFRIWAISNGYRKGLSIDRINNDGNYEPANCRWTDATGQARNRRDNVLTPAIVREIRVSAKAPIYFKHRYGLCRQHVWDVRTNRIWKNV